MYIEVHYNTVETETSIDEALINNVDCRIKVKGSTFFDEMDPIQGKDGGISVR